MVDHLSDSEFHLQVLIQLFLQVQIQFFLRGSPPCTATVLECALEPPSSVRSVLADQQMFFHLVGDK